jgi:glycine/D-amino acid oxidase-like deaminating enzyme
MKARVVVVGGGVMGVAIAWHAARRADPLTEPVVLLEKTALAAGESGRSGAILRQHYSDRIVAAMARDSLKVYSTLERNTGRSIGFQRTGVITLAGPSHPDEMALIERNIEMQRAIGIDTRRVDAREIRGLVPGIVVDDLTVGAYEPDGGGVDPVRTVQAFAALAREQGAITRIGVACTGILVGDGRARGVSTDEGEIEAEQVVIAAGPWTRALLARAGIDVPLRVVRPEQHFVEMIPASAARPAEIAVAQSEHTAEMPKTSRRFAGEAPARTDVPGEPAPVPREQPPEPREQPSASADDLEERFGEHHDGLEPAAHPVILDLDHGFYTRCEPHASPTGLRAPRTRIGRMDHSQDTDVDDPDHVDERVSAEFRRWARATLEKRLPAYRSTADVGAFVGMYTLSPDAQALIGEMRELPGLFLVSGFSGHGFKLAPSIGEGVAQLLWREPVSAFDTEFFSPERFSGALARWGRAFGL